MPTFNDSKSRLPFMTDGDYVFTVLELTKKYSQGAKTAGAPVDGLKLQLEDAKGNVSIMFEDLIDHSSTGWKYDAFLKATHAAPPKGRSFQLVGGEYETTQASDIDIIGLRGWCHVFVDDYQGKKRNKISMYICDRPGLPRAVIAPPPDADAAAFGHTEPSPSPEPLHARGEPAETDDCPF